MKRKTIGLIVLSMMCAGCGVSTTNYGGNSMHNGSGDALGVALFAQDIDEYSRQNHMDEVNASFPHYYLDEKSLRSIPTTHYPR